MYLAISGVGSSNLDCRMHWKTLQAVVAAILPIQFIDIHFKRNYFAP